MSDQSEGTVAVVKRKDDPKNEDHTGERHPVHSVDWRTAPPWVLTTSISVLLVFCGWLMGANKNLNDDRLGRIESSQLDWRKDLLLNHGQQLVDLRGDVRALQVSVGKLEAMAEDVKRIRILAEADAARRRRNGGPYGMP